MQQRRRNTIIRNKDEKIAYAELCIFGPTSGFCGASRDTEGIRDQIAQAQATTDRIFALAPCIEMYPTLLFSLLVTISSFIGI
jgi:hypothetical protein